MEKSLFCGLHHININVADMDKALEFYTGVLGFTVLSRHDTDTRKMAQAGLGGSVVELTETADRTTGDGVVNHLALSVTDIHSAFELLKKHKVEFISPGPQQVRPDLCILFFRGPSGEKIELMQEG